MLVALLGNSGEAEDNLCISFHSGFAKFCYSRFCSLKEHWDWRVAERLHRQFHEIIPGDWGKAEPGWLALSLLTGCSQRGKEAGFTGFFAGVRAPAILRENKSPAARSDEKPLQAE